MNLYLGLIHDAQFLVKNLAKDIMRKSKEKKKYESAFFDNCRARIEV